MLTRSLGKDETGKLKKLRRHTISIVQKHNRLASYKTMTLPIMVSGSEAWPYHNILLTSDEINEEDCRLYASGVLNDCCYIMRVINSAHH
jgi:hypothetical protein